MANGVKVATLNIEMLLGIAKLQEDVRKVERMVGSMGSNVNKSTAAITNSFGAVTRSAGQTRAGMQQLSYQLGDIATQFAMGAKPMQIFAAQASQVVGALGLMTQGSKGFIGFLGGPWGQIIIGAVTVLGTLAAAMWDTKETADKTKPAIDRLGDAYARLAGLMGKADAAGTQALAMANLKLKTDEADVGRISARLGDARRQLDASRAVDPRGRGSAPLMRDVAELQQQLNFAQQSLTTAKNFVAVADKAYQRTRATAAAEEAANAARKAGLSATRERNRELRETERLARAGEKAALAAAKAHQELANWLDQALGDIAERNRTWIDDMPSFLEQEVEATEAAARVREGQLQNEQRLLDVYLQQLGVMEQMGGAFGPIAGILEGLKTGNFAGIGGRAGALLSLTTGNTREVDGHAVAETLGDKLKEIFDPKGTFFQGLSSVLANAALGSTAAGLAGGSKLGGGIGGAIGGFLTGKNGPFGKALEGSLNKVFDGLGSFAGPLGSIAGGLLGGALGGLFKPKPKYGSAGLFMNEYGELAGTAGKGNAGSAIRAASGLASNVADGLNSLAEQLGAKITGVPNIALGTYDGKYRVNVEGRGGKMDFKGNSAKGLFSFGEDEQAAIEFAIQKSIEGAVLTGISQASINILKSGQDLQKAIEKATLIEDIPRELQRRLDPVGYALDDLNKKWLKTVEALREGGATAQQMADAQKLYNLELGEAKDNASSASQAMKDFLKAMNMGSSSPLSLRDQAMNAKSALDPFLAQINAGQAINQDKYLEAAQTYLDIERQMYGSTAKYFEAFDQIQAATNKAIATVDNAAPIRTTSDPFIEQTASSTKSMEANTANAVTLLQQNVELQKENNALLKKLAEKQESWTGQSRNFATR